MSGLLLALSLIAQLSSQAPESKLGEEKRLLSIHVGATLKEALFAYGAPFEAKEQVSYADGHEFLQLIYVSDVCAGTSCSVIIENGQVVKFIDVKPTLTM